MNGQTTRLVKEARQLLAPWCGIMLAGTFALVQGSAAPHWYAARYLQWIVPIGIFLGLPLLATLPIGYDFQWRTLWLLLSQPVERAAIWREKMIVTVAAMAPSAVVYLFALRATERHFETGPAMFAGCFLLVMVASAMFWTLVARSTIGGLALNTTATWLLIFAIYRVMTPSAGDPEAIWQIFDSGAIAYSLSVICAYSAVMVWLGRRLFLRVQTAGGLPGDDFVAEIGRKVVPDAVADWFRCRAGSPVLNLIRREVHLLRPVWLLTVVNALAWTNLLLFDVVPARTGSVGARPTTTAALISVALAAMLIPLIAVLAGTLSVGEEKNLGTHAWHMTLPVDPGSQWLLKLSFAVVVSAVCGGLVPAAVLAIRGWMAGSVMLYLEPATLWLWPLAAASITMVAFWCACVVKGTVRAILFVFPVFFAFGLAAAIGQAIAESVLPRLNPGIDAVVTWLDPFRLTRSVTAYDALVFLPIWLFVPGILLLVWQSHRKFRGQAEDTTRHLATSLLPVGLLIGVCSFAVWGSVHVLGRAQRQKEMVFREMHTAIQQARFERPDHADSQPIRLTVAELAKAAPLSAETRHWLGEGTITVTPERPRSVAWCCGMFYPVTAKSEAEGSSYVAMMPLTNGRSCTVTFQTFGTKYGTLGGLCN
jgi:hypothetical protein